MISKNQYEMFVYLFGVKILPLWRASRTEQAEQKVKTSAGLPEQSQTQLCLQWCGKQVTAESFNNIFWKHFVQNKV